MGRPRKIVLTPEDKAPKAPVIAEPEPPTPETVEQKIDKVNAEFHEAVEDTKPRRKYSRRRKADTEAEAVSAQTQKVNELKAAFMPVGGIAIQLLCQYLPEPIPPTPLELDLAGKATAQVIEKYAPKILGYEAEVSLAVVLAVVIIPRLGLMKKKTPQEDIPSHVTPILPVEPLPSEALSDI